MKVQLYAISILIGASYANAAAHATEKSICGVETISKSTNDGSLIIEIDGKSNRKATKLDKTKKLQTELSEFMAANELNFIKRIKIKDGDVVYLANEKTDGCVIRPGEKDGRQGYYIERHEISRNSPPIYETAFIEKN